MNKEETNIIYKEALMDICKAKKLPEQFEKLLGAKFNKILINNAYTVMCEGNSAEKELRFDVRKSENFPGDELVSQKLVIREWDKEKKWRENYTYGTIILTYHKDLNRWAGTIHLLDDEKCINRIEHIIKVDILQDA